MLGLEGSTKKCLRFSLLRDDQIGAMDHQNHELSLFLLMPFVAVTWAILRANWFPAQCFVGDTYCYFAGMTFAVAGILGHFGKTMILFFIPQAFNFVFSLPQLLKLVPCPRHRMPKFDPNTGMLVNSVATFKPGDISAVGHLIVNILGSLKMISYRKYEDDQGQVQIEVSNFTVLNLIMRATGRIKERDLAVYALGVQVPRPLHPHASFSRLRHTGPSARLLLIQRGFLSPTAPPVNAFYC